MHLAAKKFEWQHGVAPCCVHTQEKVCTSKCAVWALLRCVSNSIGRQVSACSKAFILQGELRRLSGKGKYSSYLARGSVYLAAGSEAYIWQGEAQQGRPLGLAAVPRAFGFKPFCHNSPFCGMGPAKRTAANLGACSGSQTFI